MEFNEWWKNSDYAYKTPKDIMEIAWNAAIAENDCYVNPAKLMEVLKENKELKIKLGTHTDKIIEQQTIIDNLTAKGRKGEL